VSDIRFVMLNLLFWMSLSAFLWLVSMKKTVELKLGKLRLKGPGWFVWPMFGAIVTSIVLLPVIVFL
jgi:hypothetical protein